MRTLLPVLYFFVCSFSPVLLWMIFRPFFYISSYDTIRIAFLFFSFSLEKSICSSLFLINYIFLKDSKMLGCHCQYGLWRPPSFSLRVCTIVESNYGSSWAHHLDCICVYFDQFSSHDHLYIQEFYTSRLVNSSFLCGIECFLFFHLD